ncbi:rhodanese-like domain-containing protein [Streptococcus hyovaginalis]|uniref:rhodanese-like domain-containing protein n=1 Tax=Streptococcus hyovaginalis TaxID=149015 RepID=UPI002A7F43D7|nr:rhodanese-like domain-containing protein [Streptococcus hyovaginalis]MDY4510406.1 rhodanese-like domain-containing protein [Streptococcus hyovaginalis]MDY5974548.1 rhodanese-like domain-containing protein [Streptococcus hyovaginalis]
MIKSLTVRQALSLIKDGELHLIDVREMNEYAGGHIPGAINLPLSQLAARFEDLSKDKTYYIICQSGMRSERACSFLENQGYDVINIQDGIKAWQGSLI